MANVRVQARGLKNEWVTVAQLAQSEAQPYIDCMRSDAFLYAVEQHMANLITEKKRRGEDTSKDDVEAAHLRKIRMDDKAFRVIPLWVPNTSVKEDTAANEEIA